MNQTITIPHNNPHQITFQADKISQPRPATHRYPTQARNVAHIINNISDNHTINMVLEAPDMPLPHCRRVYDSAWDTTIKIHTTPTQMDTIKPIWSLQQPIVNPHKHYMCSVMEKDTGNLMSYPQLI